MPENLTVSLDEARATLAKILTSPILGVCFLDENRHMIEIFEYDHDFREAIVEFYRQRIEQLTRSAGISLAP